jgi:hypothetical protein
METTMDQPLTPIPRDKMRGLKAETDEMVHKHLEKFRLENIQSIVRNIYNLAVQEARNTSNTSFQIDCNSFRHNIQLLRNFKDKYQKIDEFMVANVSDIVADLHVLFPGCSVRHFIMNQPPHRNPPQKTVITVDWS